MGRPPKPTKQHLLHGTYREDRHGDRLDVLTPDGAPDMPEGLSAGQSQVWQMVVDSLPAEVLSAGDAIELVGLVVWHELFERLAEAVRECDVRDKAAYSLTIRMGQAWNHVSAILGKFGMSPGDRAKLKIVPPVEELDELEEALRERAAKCGV